MSHKFNLAQGRANARLAKEFLQFVSRHPEAASKFSKDTHIIFIPTGNVELTAANMKMAASYIEKGEPVALVKWPLLQDRSDARRAETEAPASIVLEYLAIGQ